jgi:hypothetical protein
MSLGFEPNPYDKCVFNLWNKKTGKAMVRIALHVDDFLTTAKDKKLLEWLHRKLKDKYGGCSFKTGNRIKYLGIFIIVNDNGSIDLDCEDVFTYMLKD